MPTEANTRRRPRRDAATKRRADCRPKPPAPALLSQAGSPCIQLATQAEAQAYCRMPNSCAAAGVTLRLANRRTIPARRIRRRFPRSRPPSPTRRVPTFRGRTPSSRCLRAVSGCPERRPRRPTRASHGLALIGAVFVFPTRRSIPLERSAARNSVAPLVRFGPSRRTSAPGDRYAPAFLTDTIRPQGSSPLDGLIPPGPATISSWSRPPTGFVRPKNAVNHGGGVKDAMSNTPTTLRSRHT